MDVKKVLKKNNHYYGFFFFLLFETLHDLPMVPQKLYLHLKILENKGMHISMLLFRPKGVRNSRSIKHNHMPKYNITFTIYTLKKNPNHTNLKQSKLSFSLFNHMFNISTILNLQNKQAILVLNNIFKHTLDK